MSYEHRSVHLVLQLHPNTQQLLKEDADTRLLVIGDASMAPSELFSRYGNINYGEEEYETSAERLRALRLRFRHALWLNPIASHEWDTPFAASTITAIRRIFPMYDMTLDGLKKAVDHLNR